MPGKRRKAGRPARETGRLPSTFKTITPEVEQVVHNGPHLALDAIERGEGDKDYAETVLHALQVGLELRAHLAPDAALDDVLADGVFAISKIVLRAQKWGKWQTMPGEVAALREALTVYRSVLELCTMREIGLASRKVYQADQLRWKNNEKV